MPRVIVISLDGLAGFYWNDRRARMPTLRSIAARGVLSSHMETIFPSTTWPSHASLVTGVRADRHGVVANSILNRVTQEREDLTGDPVYDAAQLFRVPTIADVAHAAGLKTAAIDWPGTRHSPSIDFNMPFFKDQTVLEAHTAPHVLAELSGLGHAVERMAEWAEQPKRYLRDAVVADVAAHVVGRHAPDLILIHFLCADSFQHLYGPRSPEAYWAIEYVDERVGRFLATLPATDFPERTIVVIVSDHGFLPCDREIRINTRLRKLGLLDVDAQGRVTRAGARFVMNHGAGWIYVPADGDRAALVRQLAAELGGIEGVAQVWDEAGYGALGLPPASANPWVGDLMLEAESGYVFTDDAGNQDEIGPSRRYRGTHGNLPTRPENAAFFLAAGPGIKAGVELGPIRSVDVAPTIASLLGLRMDGSEGQVLPIFG